MEAKEKKEKMKTRGEAEGDDTMEEMTTEQIMTEEKTRKERSLSRTLGLKLI